MKKNKKITRAIILAAGRGKRLYPLTKNTPKALIKIGDKLILKHTIKALASCGIKKVVIVVGHLADQIKNKIGNKFGNVTIVYIKNSIYDNSGSLYSLFLAKNHFENGFLYMDADIIFNPMIIKNLIDSEYENAILVGHLNKDTGEEVKVYGYNDLAIDIGKNISSVHECYGEAVGIGKYSPPFIGKISSYIDDVLRENANAEHEDLAQKMCDERLMHAVSTNGLSWIEIDFAEDLKEARDVVFPKILNELNLPLK